MPAPLKKETVKRMILDFIDRKDRNPVARDFTLKGVGCGVKPIYRIWGNINSMFEDIGLLPNQVFWNKEKCIKQIKILIKELGHFPSIKEINKASNTNVYFPSEGPIYKYFNNLEELAKECGEIPNEIIWNKERIIHYIKIFIEELGYFPSSKELKEEAKKNAYIPSNRPIYKNFKSMEELAKACGEKYLPRNGFSTPVEDPIYGYFISTIEHRIFHRLLKYIDVNDIERQKKYSELFEGINSQHTADFYIEKYNIIIEATSKNNNIPKYSETKNWKESLSDNVIFVYCIEDVDNLMEKIK